MSGIFEGNIMTRKDYDITKEDLVLNLSKIFKSKFKDMRGYKYNVAALAYAPFLMKNKGNSFSGYEMYQLDAMASHLNFNYNIIEPSDSPLGNLMSILCMDIQTSQWD